MPDFNNDDDDRGEAISNRIARKVRAPEYQWNPPPVAEPDPRPEQAQVHALPRRRPPPAPAAEPKLPRPRAGGGAAEASAAAETKAENGDEERAGYGKPPRHSRFRKGESGNPRGRPKNARSLKTYLLKVLDEVVEVNEQGRVRKMTKREVIARQTVQQAMKGNLKSLAVITAFDPVEDELPEREKPLSEHEAAMLAHYLGLSGDEEDDQ